VGYYGVTRVSDLQSLGCGCKTNVGSQSLGGEMAYIVQLLPDELQAKVLMEAMLEWLDKHANDEDNETNNNERVAMIALHSKMMNDWHQHNMQEKKRQANRR
jgi:hypothetical protein